MNDIELTQLFVDYAKCKQELEKLAMWIETEVLARGETIKVAGVTATYYKPSYGTPDYENAVKEWMKNHPEDTGAWISQFSTTITSVKWKDACEYLLIKAENGAEKPARVSIK